MKKFVAREREVEKLERIIAGDGFRFIAVYGRRRVGKSELIRHVVADKDHLYFQATSDREFNLRRISSAIGKAFYGTEDVSTYSSFASALGAVVRAIGDRRFIFVIDEVSYMAQSDPDFLSVLQSFVDNDFQNCNLTLILCASSSSFMEENILGLKSPVYGRSAFPLKILPFSLAESALMLSGWSFDDVARAHAITGGIPYYLSLLAGGKDLEDALEQEFFSPGGRLLVEARLLLSMSFRNVDLYEGILDLMAHGCNEVSVLSSKSGKDKAVVSQALTKMEQVGIVARRKAVAGVGLSRGWNIADGYFQFFYRYVFQFTEAIEFGAGDAAMNQALKEIDLFTSREMEKVFQRFMLTHYDMPISTIGNVEFANRETHQNEEIDLVAVIPPDAMLFGECKWTLGQVDVNVLNKLMRRAELAYPKVDDKRYCLLSRNGYTERLTQFASASGGRVVLLSGEDVARAR